MEGPWVGSWRPHPRRGPILAEFATPGPKYWLPGSVGHTAHDPTKYRAPAYSFRGTKCPTEESCSPGPRYFIDPLITKTGKQLAPSAQVTSRPKTKITVTPGPSELHFCTQRLPDPEPAYRPVGTRGATELGLPPRQQERDSTLRHSSSRPKAEGPERGPSNRPPGAGGARNPTYGAAPRGPALPTKAQSTGLRPTPSARNTHIRRRPRSLLSHSARSPPQPKHAKAHRALRHGASLTCAL
uniref:ODF3A protein n=1 Tax=Malurus cyaneus samueli TaxID=2593467 RepID=A0A8C5TLF1_9PASS